MEISRISSAHLVGIGGIGMSAVARLLMARGMRVTGSDIKDSQIIQGLVDLGAQVSIGHCAENVRQPDVVVRTSAVGEDNIELVTARERGVPVLHRAKMLAEVVSGQETIAVTGTHGKTTITSMVVSCLQRMGMDPTAAIGGIPHDLGTNARLGRGRWAVVEACESDRSFLNLHPSHVILSNIEPEHLDHYQEFSRIQEAFSEFLCLVPEDGICVTCSDCPAVQKVLPSVRGRLVTYGFDAAADYRAEDVQAGPDGWSFGVVARGRSFGRVRLRTPGRQHACNGLASLALLQELGLDWAKAVEALAEYRGTRRRFEVLGHVDGVTVVDDYAHHPSELRATLEAARATSDGRLVAVFQPHLYSRTRLLLNGFAQAFHEADVIVITDIYGAREQPSYDVTGADLAESIRQQSNGKPVEFISPKERIPDYLQQMVRPGDLVLTLGAGDIRQVAESFLNGPYGPRGE